ncbi:NADH:flavin oxidoreductase/NADH oxidase [Acidihalobacter ferrooxydans]|uniref:Oxidoreductase n=1 Tax=Acidihalobacter ferrooxydans TaxID=1765967 RepID=A0A1P8UIL8_9GAMM|nr:NADH:flavin oxidoreductase/NADH oxidase [Acidihalobacter ferrooxydans]APZ43689.1 oxidoreductase [Acidihalobacter ferrooxydans]
MSAPLLFTPIRLRGLDIRNRIFVSPMCQYSSTDGMPNDWHLVHLGSRAVGGAGLVMTEAAAVSPEGRISAQDLGIWNDAQAAALRPIADFIRAHGAVPAIQLAHAGRKASTAPPWDGGGPVHASAGGWTPVGASAVAFAEGHHVPHALDEAGIEQIIEQFVNAAQRALHAGFEVVEVHAAHGYLLHSFLSPLSNQREDAWGGSLDNRMRLPLAVASAVRDNWPDDRPVFVRISATDWADGGWDLAQSVVFAERLREHGIDLVDCSSGGLVPDAKIPVAPGFQTPFAQTIRERAEIPTGAVGLITAAEQAEHALATGQADVVLLARELLRDPYWPLHAAHTLGADLDWPQQYARAKPR